MGARTWAWGVALAVTLAVPVLGTACSDDSPAAATRRTSGSTSGSPQATSSAAPAGNNGTIVGGVR